MNVTVLMMLAAMTVTATPVIVCRSGNPAGEMEYAQGAAKKMFAEIGVSIEWHPLKGCPADALRVHVALTSKPTEQPGALAYAMPMVGTRIVVFLDRVRGGRTRSDASRLLAHVVVHEITHLLQYGTHHSETGMMKAKWGGAELSLLTWKTLPFEENEVRLIHQGLARRAAGR